MAILDLKKTNI